MSCVTHLTTTTTPLSLVRLWPQIELDGAKTELPGLVIEQHELRTRLKTQFTDYDNAGKAFARGTDAGCASERSVNAAVYRAVCLYLSKVSSVSVFFPCLERQGIVHGTKKRLLILPPVIVY